LNANELDAMESHPGSEIVAALAHRVDHGADAAQIADAIASIWQEIDAALAPIIGKRGVTALYRRSLHLSSADHSWMAGLHEGPATAIDLTALKSALAQQDSAQAAAGGGVLLHRFHELLITLVGASLTGQLLRPVWANALRRIPSQDTLP
jgi:hypothetical protein